MKKPKSYFVPVTPAGTPIPYGIKVWDHLDTDELWDFVRQLERELNEAKKEAQHYRSVLERITRLTHPLAVLDAKEIAQEALKEQSP